MRDPIDSAPGVLPPGAAGDGSGPTPLGSSPSPEFEPLAPTREQIMLVGRRHAQHPPSALECVRLMTQKCDRCGKACHEIFTMYTHRGSRVEAGECCAPDLALLIYDMKIERKVQVVGKAMDAARLVLSIFAARFRQRVYTRNA